MKQQGRYFDKINDISVTNPKAIACIDGAPDSPGAFVLGYGNLNVRDVIQICEASIGYWQQSRRGPFLSTYTTPLKKDESDPTDKRWYHMDGLFALEVVLLHEVTGPYLHM